MKYKNFVSFYIGISSVIVSIILILLSGGTIIYNVYYIIRELLIIDGEYHLLEFINITLKIFSIPIAIKIIGKVVPLTWIGSYVAVKHIIDKNELVDVSDENIIESTSENDNGKRICSLTRGEDGISYNITLPPEAEPYAKYLRGVYSHKSYNTENCIKTPDIKIRRKSRIKQEMREQNVTNIGSLKIDNVIIYYDRKDILEEMHKYE